MRDLPGTVRATPPGAPGLAGILTVVIVGSVMSVLDVTIVNVALHPLAVAFDAPLPAVQWVATGYTLALAAVMPVAAWAMGRFGARRTYLTAVALFTIGSALASLAWNIGTLVLFRVVQGLGGGLLMPVGMAMVIRRADRKRMGRAMAYLGVPVLIGPVTGPVLGGWLVDAASWHWIFLVNLPVGVLALILGARLLPRDATAAARGPDVPAGLDLPGLLTLSPGLGLLIYGLSTGGERGDFTAPGALLPTVAGLLLMTGFVVRASTASQPLLELRLFRERTFTAALATLTLFPCAYFGSMLLTPMYYQTVRGLSATESGLLGAPLAVAVGVSMQVATRRIDRASPRLTVVPGIVVAALGLSLFAAQLGAETPYWRLCAAMAVMGTGVGMVLMPANTTATRALAPADVPSGSTMVSIASQVGASIGTALMSVALASGAAGTAGAAGTGGTSGAPSAGAYRDAYWWAVALLALAVVPALLLPSRRRSREETPVPTHPNPSPTPLQTKAQE
ncbi:DHA2 family efflux MFS transporter permease subunit [Streptomyces sp. 150FB]|uniref:DHA2 family efflux MFS transporter permease subunit n=1 Tax=Streptomyces sp. 150FB TaxID=1576605 RepID=UPI0007C7D0F5|nr:DHA2 family efflux MFS transporter permease subunit [Streptomyces sp. 150FB]